MWGAAGCTGVTINDVIIIGCEDYGILASGNARILNLIIERVTIRGGRVSLFNWNLTAGHDRTGRCQFCEFTGASEQGVRHEDPASSVAFTYRKLIVDDCATNILLDDIDIIETIVEDCICSNGDFGISVTSSVQTLTPDNNCLFNNTDDISGAADSSNIFTDPRYISRLGSDVYPRHNSPTIDAGSNFTGWENETDRWGRPYITDDLGCYARRVRPTRRWGVRP